MLYQWYYNCEIIFRYIDCLYKMASNGDCFQEFLDYCDGKILCRCSSNSLIVVHHGIFK